MSEWKEDLFGPSRDAIRRARNTWRDIKSTWRDIRKLRIEYKIMKWKLRYYKVTGEKYG